MSKDATMTADEPHDRLHDELHDRPHDRSSRPHPQRSSLRLSVPAHAQCVLDTLEDAGFEAWCVGGFVRDGVLGRECHDVDVTTNACWSQVEKLFASKGCETRRSGVKHGTLTVLIGDEAVEVTTYRIDGPYADSRHPDSISVAASIEEDLARRDFTMNALAYSPLRGVVDPYGGLADIENGVIRAVGNPAKRFKEDALRILRACRFCSQLGFRIEEGTYSGMLAGKGGLRSISIERVTHELDELLLGDHVHDAIMETVDVLAFVLPELVSMKDLDQKTRYHVYDVLEHTAWAVQYTPPHRIVRWAALFHDMGKPAAMFEGADGIRHFYSHAHVSVQLARAAMERLLIGPGTSEKVLRLVRHHDDLIEPTPKAVKKMLGRLNGDVELFGMLCDLKRADALAQAPAYRDERLNLAEDLRRIAQKVVSEDQAFTLKQLAINGRDVMDLGLPAGPEVGALLNRVLDAVIDDQVDNERQQLIEFARQRLANGAS